MSIVDEAGLLGTWKLVSWVSEDVETQERRALFGNRPTGYIIFIALMPDQGPKRINGLVIPNFSDRSLPFCHTQSRRILVAKRTKNGRGQKGRS
jgi:hypothetical protein